MTVSFKSVVAGQLYILTRTRECCTSEIAPSACLPPAAFETAVDRWSGQNINPSTDSKATLSHERGPDNSLEAGTGFFISQK